MLELLYLMCIITNHAPQLLRAQGSVTVTQLIHSTEAIQYQLHFPSPSLLVQKSSWLLLLQLRR